MKFECDDNKARLNEKLHGVKFEEAELAFQDQNAVEIFDELNSDEEIRFQIIAPSARSIAVCRIYNARRRNYSYYFSGKSRCQTNENLQQIQKIKN